MTVYYEKKPANPNEGDIVCYDTSYVFDRDIYRRGKWVGQFMSMDFVWIDNDFKEQGP